MYNKDAQKEILSLLREMNEKLDHLSAAAASPQEDIPSSGTRQEEPKCSPNNTMWNLTQSQYEISNELFEGIKKLKNVIVEGEKHSIQAKREYKK